MGYGLNVKSSIDDTLLLSTDSQTLYYQGYASPTNMTNLGLGISTTQNSWRVDYRISGVATSRPVAFMGVHHTFITRPWDFYYDYATSEWVFQCIKNLYTATPTNDLALFFTEAKYLSPPASDYGLELRDENDDITFNSNLEKPLKVREILPFNYNMYLSGTTWVLPNSMFPSLEDIVYPAVQVSPRYCGYYKFFETTRYVIGCVAGGIEQISPTTLRCSPVRINSYLSSSNLNGNIVLDNRIENISVINVLDYLT